jgi:hypothetical protein
MMLNLPDTVARIERRKVLTIRPKSKHRPAGILGPVVKCCYPDCSRSGAHEAFFLDHEWQKFLLCNIHMKEFEGLWDEITEENFEACQEKADFIEFAS